MAANYKQHFNISWYNISTGLMKKSYILTFKFCLSSRLHETGKKRSFESFRSLEFYLVIDSGDLTSMYNWFQYLIFLREINFFTVVKWKKAYLIQSYCNGVIIVILLYCGPCVMLMSPWDLCGDSHCETTWRNLSFSVLAFPYCLLFIWISDKCYFSNKFSSNKTPVWLLSVVWLKEINTLDFSVQTFRFHNF